MKNFNAFERYKTPEEWKSRAYAHTRKKKIKLQYKSFAAVCCLLVCLAIGVAGVITLSSTRFETASQSDWKRVAQTGDNSEPNITRPDIVMRNSQHYVYGTYIPVNTNVGGYISKFYIVVDKEKSSDVTQDMLYIELNNETKLYGAQDQSVQSLNFAANQGDVVIVGYDGEVRDSSSFHEEYSATQYEDVMTEYCLTAKAVKTTGEQTDSQKYKDIVKTIDIFRLATDDFGNSYYSPYVEMLYEQNMENADNAQVTNLYGDNNLIISDIYTYKNGLTWDSEDDNMRYTNQCKYHLIKISTADGNALSDELLNIKNEMYNNYNGTYYDNLFADVKITNEYYASTFLGGTSVDCKDDSVMYIIIQNQFVNQYEPNGTQQLDCGNLDEGQSMTVYLDEQNTKPLFSIVFPVTE